MNKFEKHNKRDVSHVCLLKISFNDSFSAHLSVSVLNKNLRFIHEFLVQIVWVMLLVYVRVVQFNSSRDFAMSKFLMVQGFNVNKIESL